LDKKATPRVYARSIPSISAGDGYALLAGRGTNSGDARTIDRIDGKHARRRLRGLDIDERDRTVRKRRALPAEL
jgi:hypothetical protein